MDAKRYLPGRRLARKVALAAVIVGPAVGSPMLLPDLTVLATTESAFGCEVESQKPDVQDGEMVGRATIKCAAALPGRAVRVEVWQKDDDGVWQQLSESVTDWEGVDLDQPFHRIDSAGFWCKKTEGDRTRAYRTRVVVGDGAGQEVETISNTEQLRRHCLAESAIEDPSLPPDSGAVSAAQGTPMGVTCKPILFTPAINGNFIDAKTRFECASIPYNDYRILLVRLAEVTPVGAYKTKKNVSYFDDGRYEAWFPTLIASCRKGSNQTTKYVTWARETYRPEFGRGDTARNTSSQVNLQARCA